MKKLSIFFVIIPLLFIYHCSKEEDNPVLHSTRGIITGKVIDKKTGSAITGAAVTSQPPTKSIVTDDEGRFSIPDVEEGSYIILVSKDGYITAEENAVLKANQTVNLDIALSVIPAEPSAPEVYINLFQNKEIIDTARIQITVVDTARIQEVVFYVDGNAHSTFTEKEISFDWELPQYEDGTIHQVFCTAKNIYNKMDSTEVFNLVTFKTDTAVISSIDASEDSIFIAWEYPKNYDYFRTNLIVSHNNRIVLSEIKNAAEKKVVFKDSLNDFYDYSLQISAVLKGQTSFYTISKAIALKPTPKIDSLTAPNTVEPASSSHFKISLKVTSKDQLKNIKSVYLYIYHPDNKYQQFNMLYHDLTKVSAVYTLHIPTGNLPVLGKYRLEAQAIHKNGRKSRLLKRDMIVR